jgi:LCP family protein required for cell wall assembly
VKVDFVNAQASALALPRDIWVPIPRLEEQEITEGRLSHAYHWGGAFLGRDQGPSVLADTLYQNFGLPVDHYFAINKRGFARAINALGGVDVCLPEPIYRWTTDKPYLEEGCSRLSGAEALWLNRIRVPYSDLQRIQHQNQFLTELLRTALRPATLTALPELFSSFRDVVLTDLSKAEVASLLCLLPKIQPEQIDFYTLDEDLLTPVTRASGAQIFEPEFSAVRAYVDRFLGGQLAADEDESAVQ